jgi:hypothetical protein
MGHSAVCQVGRRRFFYDDKIGLKSVYMAIAPRQKYATEIRDRNPLMALGRQAVQYGERQPVPREPALANSPT